MWACDMCQACVVMWHVIMELVHKSGNHSQRSPSSHVEDPACRQSTPDTARTPKSVFEML